MKNLIDKIYYPIQPLYQKVWSSHGDQAKTVQEIAEIERVPIAERQDLTLQDKLKANEKMRQQTEKAALEDAQREHEQLEEKREKYYESILQERTRNFINENDFVRHTEDCNAPGEVNFKNFVNQYISYRYEPTDLDFEEARYFCEDYDKSLLEKMQKNEGKKVISI